MAKATCSRLRFVIVTYVGLSVTQQKKKGGGTKVCGTLTPVCTGRLRSIARRYLWKKHSMPPPRATEGRHHSLEACCHPRWGYRWY